MRILLALLMLFTCGIAEATYNPSTERQVAVSTLGSDTDTITISNLDLNTDRQYRIVIDYIMASMADYANLHAYINGDTTNTNYNFGRIQYSGAFIGAGNEPFIGAADSCSSGQIELKVYRDQLGVVWMDALNVGSVSLTTWSNRSLIQKLGNGVSNVTQVDIIGDNAGCFLAETVITVYTEAGQAVDPYSSTLLHFDGADASTTFTDSGIWGLTVTAGGDAQLDTAQKKFGTASLLLDGTDTASMTSDVFDAGTGDFTYDMWVRISSWNAFNGNNMIVDRASGIAHYLIIQSIADVDTLYCYVGNSNSSVAQDFVLDTWYHLAVERYNGTAYVYVNGTSVMNFAAAGTVNSGSNFNLGNDAGVSSGMIGWIDEFRFVKVAKYKGVNFTPPTEAYAR